MLCRGGRLLRDSETGAGSDDGEIGVISGVDDSFEVLE
jgi:hypothetical protein